MRRREKFVIAALILSLGLWGVQLLNLELRYLAVTVLSVVSYFVSAWALSDDLQKHEWLTVLPFPAMYTLAIGMFYFLLPENLLSRLGMVALFTVGMYALFLTANIYSVAKGRTIQLLHAAHAVGLLFTLLTSLLLTNTLFSLRFPWWVNGAVVGVIHLPLAVMSLWAVELEPRISKYIWSLSGLLTLILVEVAIILSFMPLSVWNAALLIMAMLYIGVGILHNFLQGRLFSNTLNEYSLVAVLVAVVFFLVLPWK